MPDDRLQRTRTTLPADYQWGDSAPSGKQWRFWRERRKAQGRLDRATRDDDRHDDEDTTELCDA